MNNDDKVCKDVQKTYLGLPLGNDTGRRESSYQTLIKYSLKERMMMLMRIIMVRSTTLTRFDVY